MQAINGLVSNAAETEEALKTGRRSGRSGDCHFHYWSGWPVPHSHSVTLMGSGSLETVGRVLAQSEVRTYMVCVAWSVALTE